MLQSVKRPFKNTYCIFKSKITSFVKSRSALWPLLQMNTPLKKISIVADRQMRDPFSVSLINQYDDKRPLRTLVTLDAKNKKVDFQMNYDLGMPHMCISVQQLHAFYDLRLYLNSGVSVGDPVGL